MAVRKNPKFPALARQPFPGEVATRYAGPHPGNPRHKRPGYQERLAARKTQQTPARPSTPAKKGLAKYRSVEEQRDHLKGKIK